MAPAWGSSGPGGLVTVNGVEVADRLRAAGSELTVTERRIAEVVLGSPQTVAFGTVASVAEAAGAGTATVVRLATKLGYEGWAALQRSVQAELTNRLGPAAQRIRAIDGDAVVARHGDAEHRNLTGTFESLDPEVVRDVVAALHDPARPVLVLSGSADPVTPAQFGERILPHLSNARHIVNEGQGHGQAALGCIPILIAEFVRDADPAGLDADCTRRLVPAPFFLDFTGPAP